MVGGVLGKKLVKKDGKEPTELENSLAQALLDLEASSKDLKADLRDLYILAAKEIEVDESRRAIVVFVPFVLHRRFKNIQPRLVRELEKKFANRHVVFVAQRTVLGKNYARLSKGALRPRSRTLTSVHEAILNDVVYPTEIVGKRTRVRLDGSRLLKVFVDPKDAANIDYKLSTFGAVYGKLTNRRVEFMFPPKN